MKILITNYLTGLNAIEPNFLSTIDFASVNEGKDLIIETGLAKMIKSWACGINAEINNPVNKIKWGKDLIEVHTKSKKYISKTVLITVSTGILKNQDIISLWTVFNGILNRIFGVYPLGLALAIDITSETGYLMGNTIPNFLGLFPNSINLSKIIQNNKDEFQAGIIALSKLTEGSVYLTSQKTMEFDNATNVTIEGPHPAGNVGIQIHHIKPINPGEVIVSGKVIKAGNSIAFLEGEILDKKNNLLAKANQTVKLIKNFY